MLYDIPCLLHAMTSLCVMNVLKRKPKPNTRNLFKHEGVDLGVVLSCSLQKPLEFSTMKHYLRVEVRAMHVGKRRDNVKIKISRSNIA